MVATSVLLPVLVIVSIIGSTLIIQPQLGLFGNENLFIKFRLETGDEHFIKAEGWVFERSDSWDVVYEYGKDYGYLHFVLPNPYKDKVLKIRCESGNIRNKIELYASMDGKKYVKLFGTNFYGERVFIIEISSGYKYFYFYLEADWRYIKIYKDVYYAIGELISFDLTPSDPHFVSKGGDIKYSKKSYCGGIYIDGWSAGVNGGYVIFKVPEIKDCGSILIINICNLWGYNYIGVYSSKDGYNYESLFKKHLYCRNPCYKIELKLIVPKEHKYFKIYMDREDFSDDIVLYKNIRVFVVERLPIASIEVADIVGYITVSAISAIGVLLILSRLLK